jgi:hypothetical protein
VTPRTRRLAAIAMSSALLLMAACTPAGDDQLPEAPQLVSTPQPPLPADPTAQPFAPVHTAVPDVEAYYANCDEVRAAGVAPLDSEDPGYRPALDRDDDGLACE